VVGVEREEARQEERVAGETEREGERVELESEAEVVKMELEEEGDGAEKEVGGGGGGCEAEAGEGHQRERDKAEGRKAGEIREEGMKRVIAVGSGRSRRRLW
jgi:hypothetical protein